MMLPLATEECTDVGAISPLMFITVGDAGKLVHQYRI